MKNVLKHFDYISLVTVTGASWSGLEQVKEIIELIPSKILQSVIG